MKVATSICTWRFASAAAAFGMIEATARMKFFNNRNADDRELIFLVFALGYVVLVELVSLVGNRFERRWAVSR